MSWYKHDTEDLFGGFPLWRAQPFNIKVMKWLMYALQLGGDSAADKLADNTITTLLCI